MIIRQGYFPPIFFQQGFATLTVALMISFLATFMTLYAARVGVMAQRISANEFRAEEAFAAAEAGVEEGIAYLRGNRKQIDSWSWTSCSNEIIPPCGNGTENVYDSDWEYYSSGNAIQPVKGSYSLYFLKHTAVTAAPVFFVVAKGKSADQSGQALIKQGVYFYPFIVNIPDAPLMAGGKVSLSGNFSVAEAAYPGWRGTEPLSIWAKGDVTLGGNASTVDSSGADILDADTTNFPADLFEYILGMPGEESQAIKNEATLLANCDSLDNNSSGLYWIAGDCTVNSNGSIGSDNAPVLLIVKGNIKINGNRQIYGLIFSFPDPSASSTVQINVELNGNATVHGAMIANKDISQANGNFEMYYDNEVLQNLRSNISSRGFALIPGSWADY